MSSYLSFKSEIIKTTIQDTLQVRPQGGYLTDKRARLKASVTVEAALALPLMILSMVLLILPLHMMGIDCRIQKICEETAGEVSKYMYTVNEVRKGREGIADSSFIDISDGPALGAFTAARIKSEVNESRLDIVDILGSDVDMESCMVTVRIEYGYDLPLNIFGLDSLRQEAAASRRAWVGMDGFEDGESGEAEDDPWVYIGKNATRYHLSPHCHYLSNDWSTGIVGADGKASGRTPCERCAKNHFPGQTVYFTSGGDRYHTDTGCSAMKSYPRMVRLSEVEHLGCCSYCEKHYRK